jgi:hypothetical protein
MKPPRVNGRAALAAALVFAGLSPSTSHAQTEARIDFRNRIPGLLDAPVCDADGITTLAGPNWFAQLWAGGTADSLAPIGVPMPFLEEAQAGYWMPATVSVPWIHPGEAVWVQVRVLAYLRCGEPFLELAPRAVSRVMEITTGDSPAPLLALEHFSVLRPTLSLQRQGNQVVLSWAHFGEAFYRLEQSDRLGPWAGWKTVWTLTDPCANYFGMTLTVSVDNGGAAGFFRLSP